jgi:hypothetical protein
MALSEIDAPNLSELARTHPVVICFSTEGVANSAIPFSLWDKYLPFTIIKMEASCGSGTCKVTVEHGTSPWQFESMTQVTGLTEVLCNPSGSGTASANNLVSVDRSARVRVSEAIDCFGLVVQVWVRWEIE